MKGLTLYLAFSIQKISNSLNSIHPQIIRKSMAANKGTLNLV